MKTRIFLFLILALLATLVLVGCSFLPESEAPATTTGNTTTASLTTAATATPGTTTTTTSQVTTAPPTTTAATTTTAPPVTTPPTTTAPKDDTSGWWDDVDFSDVNLRIAYNEVNVGALEEAGAGNAIQYMKGPDDYADANRGDYLAAWQRHELVCDRLGLTLGENLTYVKTGFPSKLVDSILPLIAQYAAVGGDSAPNIVIHLNYGIVRAGIVGYFYNAYTTEDFDGNAIDNYFDFTHDNWNLEAMEENTIDTDKIYMLMGDYFIDQLRFAMATLVNSGIADEVFAYQGGLDYLYDLVYNGQWTYDAMMQCAAAAGETSVGGQSVMGAISNRWLIRNYFSASGLDVFERDANGDPKYVTDITEIHDWLDKLISMEKEDYFSWDWATDDVNNPERNSPLTTFMNGDALFSLNEYVLTMEGENIQNMRDVAGILPNPKYIKEGEYADESTDYRAPLSHEASSGGIMITSTYEEFSAATAFLQLMTEESDNVFYQYFVAGLQYRENNIGREHIDMLNYIKDGICSPMSMLYDNYCAQNIPGAYPAPSYPNLMYDSLQNKNNTFASKWAESITARTYMWESIKAEIRNRWD